jgi:hypothetical protein
VYRYCSLKNNVLWTKKGQSCEAAAMWWSGFVFSFSALVKRNDLKYERNEIIALLAKALLEKAVSRNYVRGANS